MLVKHWNDINENKGFEVDSYFRKRKIGDNPIVLKAFQELKNCKNAYHIGLIPTLENDIKCFLLGKEDLGIHFLSWETIHQFCIDKKIENVLEIFKFNEGQIY